MNDDMYQPPQSELINGYELANQKKLVRLKWITFSLLLLIGLPGLFITGCGIVFISYSGIGLISAIPGTIICYCVFRGLRTVFSERGKDYARLKETYTIAIISFIILLFLLFALAGF